MYNTVIGDLGQRFTRHWKSKLAGVCADDESHNIRERQHVKKAGGQRGEKEERGKITVYLSHCELIKCLRTRIWEQMGLEGIFHCTPHDSSWAPSFYQFNEEQAFTLTPQGVKFNGISEAAMPI